MMVRHRHEPRLMTISPHHRIVNRHPNRWILKLNNRRVFITHNCSRLRDDINRNFDVLCSHCQLRVFHSVACIRHIIMLISWAVSCCCFNSFECLVLVVVFVFSFILLLNPVWGATQVDVEQVNLKRSFEVFHCWRWTRGRISLKFTSPRSHFSYFRNWNVQHSRWKFTANFIARQNSIGCSPLKATPRLTPWLSWTEKKQGFCGMPSVERRAGLSSSGPPTNYG